MVQKYNAKLMPHFHPEPLSDKSFFLCKKENRRIAPRFSFIVHMYRLPEAFVFLTSLFQRYA